MKVRRTRGKGVALLLAAVPLIVVIAWYYIYAGPAADTTLRDARRLIAEKNFDAAEPLLLELRQHEEFQSTASLLAAECAIARGDTSDALDYLKSVSTNDDAEWLKTRRLEADILHYDECRLSDARQIYAQILKQYPKDVRANEQMARLLGLCGLRDLAIPHVLNLIAQGENSDLLMLLARETWGMTNPELLQKAHASAPNDPLPLMGQAWEASARQDYSLANELLAEAVARSGSDLNLRGKQGLVYLKLENKDLLNEWLADFVPETATADEWEVVAAIADQNDQEQIAMRAYWELLRQRPESLHATNRLAQLLSEQDEQTSQTLLRRLEELQHLRDEQRRCLVANRNPTASDYESLADAYHGVGRLWETVAWLHVAASGGDLAPSTAQKLYKARQQLLSLPQQLTAPSFNVALNLNFADVPIQFQSSAVAKESAKPRPFIRFKEQSDEIGFTFQFQRGAAIKSYDMLGFNGGGIGVIDVDGDDFPDVFLTQGDDVESGSERASDQIFRNVLGERWKAVTDVAGTNEDSGFGQGVSVGDVNNDGFQDLYLAQTTENVLLINNGDGTFSDASGLLPARIRKWTTSCLIADLNADGNPDLLDVNYLADADVFTRVCRDEQGNRTQCVPFDFHGETDDVWLSDSLGTFTAAPSFLDPPSQGKGLGIVALRNQADRLSLFIANDAVPNAFYQPLNQEAEALTDTAVASGLAVSGHGKAEACMGVAAADIDGNGLMDLYVTNFLHESNTLYSQSAPSIFEDRTGRYSLEMTSLPVLGWGTQFIDANLDGNYELFVANGHTQDLSSSGTPYAMPPLLYTFEDDSFVPVAEEQPGNWAFRKVVGRSVAVIDWNRDGKSDLCFGKLDEPYSLLTNDSEAARNSSTVLKFSATNSARDAIGTEVRLKTRAGRTFTYQLTGGNGFQCTNERHLIIHGDALANVDSIELSWPSGSSEILRKLSPGRYAVVEGQAALRLP